MIPWYTGAICIKPTTIKLKTVIKAWGYGGLALTVCNGHGHCSHQYVHK